MKTTLTFPLRWRRLHVALGEAVHNLLALNMIKPLGAWMEDELVLAALDRYRGDLRQTGDFLHTKPRNISRWLPKIASREEERNGSALWQKPRRLLREWVRESPQSADSPLLLMADKLMAHVNEQGGALSSATRASIMGVSTPTYLKRMREIGEQLKGVLSMAVKTTGGRSKGRAPGAALPRHENRGGLRPGVRAGHG